MHGSVTSLSGQEIAALSAHQVLHDLNVVLLVLAAHRPARRADWRWPGGAASRAGRAGRAIVLVGLLASVCVIYRMAEPPVPAGGLVALSLREGSWLALLGSLMMVLGPIWPRVSLRARPEGALIRV